MIKIPKLAPKKSAIKAAAVKRASRKIARAKIITLLAGKTSLGRKHAGKAVAAVLSNVIYALSTGQSGGLFGMGALSATQTVGRTGVRPDTSERITIPAGKKVRFKVASTLKGTP